MIGEKCEKMVKRTGPTNAHMQQEIERLRKLAKENQTAIWADVAEKLANSRRSRVEVNVGRIERNANNGDVIIVPGVVLAAGEIAKPVSVAAWKFSAGAGKKIKDAGGKCMTIDELVKENPKGSGVRIFV
jgi:large subunit ribosomal protein L18e